MTGGRVPDERVLDLPGYPGGRDRAGNWVNDQLQLDNFGESLLLLAAAGRHDRLDLDRWRAAEVAVDAIAARWTEPDAGIWELDNAPLGPLPAELRGGPARHGRRWRRRPRRRGGRRWPT